MASPSSSINFLPSEVSPTLEPRRSSSPFSRARSPLRYRESGYGHLSSLGALPLSTSDPAQLQQVVVQLSAQVKGLQQERDEEMDNIAQLRRRLNDSEREKLELTTAFNSENSDLQAQIAKLRAQLEKGEADKQNVEYELAVARQSVSREKMGASEKEQQLKGIISSQSEKLSTLSAQVQELQIQASQYEREMVNIKSKHHRELDEQEKRLASVIAERDVLQTAKDEIEQVFHEQESLYSDAQEKITELRIERNTQSQTVRQQLHDLQLAAERDESTKSELMAAKEELKEMQERIEKERAAHTESKFNFEIVQCQKRDLEGALSVEKSAREQAIYNMDAMSKQIRELEAAYQEERRECAYNKEQVQRLTAEYETTKYALTAEVDQKREVLSGTSKQIDLYQKNFNGLKDELTRAKKRQIYLEETYGGCMRELELLLTNFHVMGEGNLRPKRKTVKGKGKKSGGEGTGVGSQQELSPSLVLETLRHTLTNYQQRLDETTQELKRMKVIHEKLANECEHYKEVTYSRDHMVKDLQTKLSSTVKELEKVKGQYSEQETTLSRLKVKLQRAQQGHENEQTKAYNMADEFVRQLTNLENEQENRKLYLHSIYQRLLAGRVVMQEDLAKNGAQGLGWPELSAGVQEEVVQLMSNVSKANEKVVLLESELRTKKEQFMRLEDNHKDALDRLAQSAQQRETNWVREKEELEHRYQKKIEELKIKTQKSKNLASDALSKARHDGSAKQELESQMSQLSATLATLRTENSSLLAACALLGGALLPVYTRLGQLAAQRRILEQQIGNVDAFKRQARELAQMLAMEPGKGESLPGANRDPSRTKRRRSSRCLLMRFRVAAIAVMAAHRLLYLAGQTDLLFTTSENTSGSYAVPLCLGNAHMPQRSFSGMNSIASTRSLLEAQTAGWLTSPDLQARVIASVADLQQLIGQSGTGNGPSNHSIIQASMSAFESLVSRLAPCFTTVSTLAPTAPTSYPPYRQPTYMVRGPLVRCLGHGLNRLLAHTSLAGVKNQYVTIEQTMITLQNQMVDFLDRLHQAEVDRRSLKKENGRLRQETGQLRLSSDIASDLQQEVAKLQEKIQDTVERGKFEKVFQELQQALGREQEAQRILTEQSNRLEEMGIQLNVKTTEELEKDHNITEAIKGLSEAKMELRRKEQSVRQLSRQLSQMENERRSLQDSLNAAESALKANTRDRESVVTQLRSLQTAVSNTKHHLLARADSQTIDSSLAKIEAQLLVTAISSPDVIALQSLVSTFVETQKTAISRLTTLELEITSHKQHITRLKEELADACSRQMAEGEVTPCVNGYMTSTGDRSIGRPYKPFYETDRSNNDVFLPLREVSDHSMQVMSTPAIARQDYLAGVGMSTPAGISSSPIKLPRV
ncbi:coiled-coil domain-containing protein 171-like isoform X1 [Lytechinus pictus]|uniref:coiled-coil domain-containing protein 171-like isoform X1 n=1 Tax=Lytechinus pictus TaxID=7653 RepID=UPI0030BA192B